MIKVLFLTNIPSPYRVDFFNEFGKYVDLTVLFEIDSSTERDESWKGYQFHNFNGIIMKGVRTSYDTAFCPTVIKHLNRNSYDYIFVTCIASLTGLLAAAWLKMHHIPYFYEGDGGVPGKKTGLKAAWKRYIIRDAKLCFSPTRDFDEYCLTYGASKDRIVRYPFSSIFEKNIIDHVVEEENKKCLKEKLGINEESIILSVGRIVPLKRFDVLLNAFGDVSNNNWGLYIVGGECTKELEQIIKDKKIGNVHFVDFMLPEQLGEYYRAADFFVLPTSSDTWGLVINEAMAAGLPVITTFQCGAGTAMVEEQNNGYLYHYEDTEALKKYMRILMESADTRQQFAEKTLDTVKGYTIEAMAQKHYEILEERNGEKAGNN